MFELLYINSIEQVKSQIFFCGSLRCRAPCHVARIAFEASQEAVLVRLPFYPHSISHFVQIIIVSQYVKDLQVFMQIYIVCFAKTNVFNHFLSIYLK